MIAGGSGLTPMMQVASQILSNSDDKTQVWAPNMRMPCPAIVVSAYVDATA